MMSQVLSYLAGVYESLGLGVVVAAALPTVAVVLGVIVGVARKRYGHGGGTV